MLISRIFGKLCFLILRSMTISNQLNQFEEWFHNDETIKRRYCMNVYGMKPLLILQEPLITHYLMVIKC